MLRYDDGVMVARGGCAGIEPGLYWGWCTGGDIGDSDADDGNAVNVKDSGTYVRGPAE